LIANRRVNQAPSPFQRPHRDQWAERGFRRASLDARRAGWPCKDSRGPERGFRRASLDARRAGWPCKDSRGPERGFRRASLDARRAGWPCKDSRGPERGFRRASLDARRAGWPCKDSRGPERGFRRASLDARRAGCAVQGQPWAGAGVSASIARCPQSRLRRAGPAVHRMNDAMSLPSRAPPATGEVNRRGQSTAPRAVWLKPPST
jgi:hypothetical protein